MMRGRVCVPLAGEGTGRCIYLSEEDAVGQELESVGRMLNVLLKRMAGALGEAGAAGDGQTLLVPLRAEVSVFRGPGSARARGRGGGDGGDGVRQRGQL